MPGRGVDEVGEHSFGGGMFRGLFEETGFAQFGGERRGCRSGWGGAFEAVDGVAAIIHDVDFTVLGFTEVGDSEAGACDEAIGSNGIFFPSCRADLAGAVVAVEVVSLEFRKLVAAIHDTPSEGAEVFVGVFNHGFCDGVRTAFSEGLKVMISLNERPSVVGAFANNARVLPEVLSVLSDPDIVGNAIDVHSPRIAKPVGPRLGACSRNGKERIVGGDAVGSPVGGMVDVDAEEFCVEPGEVLSGVPLVAIAGTVSGGDVEHAIVAKAEGESVMAVRVPFEKEGTRGGVYFSGGGVHAEPEETVIEFHFSFAEAAIGADENESVGFEVGVEAEVVDGFFEGEEGFGVFGCRGGDACDAAFAGGPVSVVFEEELGVGVRFGDEGDGKLGFEVGEGFGGVERGRRFG